MSRTIVIIVAVFLVLLAAWFFLMQPESAVEDAAPVDAPVMESAPADPAAPAPN